MWMTCFEILETCPATKIAASPPKLIPCAKTIKASNAGYSHYYGIIQYPLFDFTSDFWISAQFLMYNLLESFQV